MGEQPNTGAYRRQANYPSSGPTHYPGLNQPHPTHFWPVQAQTRDDLARPRLPWVWLALPIQMVVGLIVLTPLWICIYFSMPYDYDGVLTLIGFTVMVVLAPWITVCAAALIGLPIRLIPALRRWWTSNGEVGLAGVVIGYGLVLAGSFSRHRETGVMDGVPYDVLSPDTGMLFAGWLVVGFFIVHTWIPLRWFGRRGQTNTAARPRGWRTLRKP